MKKTLRAGLTGLLLLFFAAALLLMPDVTTQAAREGLRLCAQVLVPSLFPFFVCAKLIVTLRAASPLERLLAPVMRRLFSVRVFVVNRIIHFGRMKKIPFIPCHQFAEVYFHLFHLAFSWSIRACCPQRTASADYRLGCSRCRRRCGPPSLRSLGRGSHKRQRRQGG